MARVMKDSGIEWIGEIPQEWELRKHKYLFDCGKEIVGEKSNTTQLLSLTTQGVKKKSIDAVGGKLPETFDTYQLVDKNDLIMCLFDLDCSAVFSGLSYYEGMISPAYKVLKCNNKLYPKFADFWFRFVFEGRKFKPYAKNLRYTLNFDEFASISMALPHYNEQQKIADFLDHKCAEIDRVIEETNKTIEEYKTLKQSIITEAVTKGIRGNRPMKDSGSQWFGSVPEDWNIQKLKYVFRIVKDIAGEEGYDVLSITQRGVIPKNIASNEGQLANDYSNYQFLKKGQFAMNHMDLLTGWVDISKYDGVTSPDYRVFKLIDIASMSSEYYLYLMQLCYFNKIFYGLGQGVSGLGRWRLQADKFLNFYIPVPPYSEQLEIAKYLNKKCMEFDKLIEAKQQLLTELENYKKSVIYEYVTGKKEVQ